MTTQDGSVWTLGPEQWTWSQSMSTRLHIRARSRVRRAWVRYEMAAKGCARPQLPQQLSSVAMTQSLFLAQVSSAFL